eukprot:m.132423 g.132423  ORF g.132423 m.132423 type:complete len:380 (-) comp29605_c0_seq1:321-1460(-)
MWHDFLIFLLGVGVGGVLMSVVGKDYGDCFGQLYVVKKRWQTKINANKLFYASVAQVVANSCFGIGSVVGKIGLPNMNPILFATVRELGAAIILCIVAYRSYGLKLPSFKDRTGGLALLCGFAVVIGQFLFLLGLKMSSAVTASVWQPSQPIWTMLMAVALGREQVSKRKVLGVLLAFAGCAFMVLESSPPKGSHSVAAWIPNLMFFGNCLGTPIYILCAKSLVEQFPSLWVTAWAYVVAFFILLVILLITNNSPVLLNFMCPAPDATCGDGWQIPEDAMWALLYWIFFVSALAYFLVTWGNKHLDSSIVSSYFALQPVAAAIVSTLVVMGTRAPHYGLQGPGVQHLGAIGVFLGLYFVTKGSLSTDPKLAPDSSANTD